MSRDGGSAADPHPPRRPPPRRVQYDRRCGLLDARRGYHDRPRVLDLPEASPSTAVTRRRGRRRRRIAD
jgi:hypothetical protein